MSRAPKKHHRRSLRLQGYDYAQAGVYFITLCTHDRTSLFGEVVAGRMQLNEYGTVVRERWRVLPRHFSRVRLDAFVVMPNHVHGIVIIKHPLHPHRRRGEASDETPPPARAQPSVQPGTIAPAVPDASPFLDVDGDVHGRSAAIHTPGEASRRPGTPEPPPTGGAGREVDSELADGEVGYGRHMGYGGHWDGPTGVPPGSLGAIVQSFKSTATRKINRRRGTPGGPVWQRGYWERILRDDPALHIVRCYVKDNPARWEGDVLHTGAF